VKIEHDHCAWERSFNPTSTASVGSFFSYPHQHLHSHHPNASPTANHNPKCAPPLCRGMWAISIGLMEGSGEPKGGTQEVGGPGGASGDGTRRKSCPFSHFSYRFPTTTNRPRTTPTPTHHLPPVKTTKHPYLGVGTPHDDAGSPQRHETPRTAVRTPATIRTDKTTAQ